MAHRLFMRRIWTLCGGEIRCLPSATATAASSSFSSSLQSAQSRVSFLSPPHSLPGALPQTFSRAVSFNVQDHEDFTERVVNSDLPVLVDFHAQWCGPCKILGPRLEKAVAKQKGRVAMAKVDIDDHTDLAIEYGVRVRVVLLNGRETRTVGGLDPVPSPVCVCVCVCSPPGLCCPHSHRHAGG
uniref:Thioredoxin 2 n=1 Tax=Cynoglossus semilaevis TaxID=244447 RepID=A0A3P8W9B9_CYNSE